MKKYVIILLAFVVLLLGVAYVKLFAKQAAYQQTIVASTNSVLSLQNVGRSGIRIVTGDTDKITIDLNGSAQDIIDLLQSEDGDVTTIHFPDGSAGLSGTITVPKGMLIDVSLSGDATININDAGGKKTVNGKNSFLIDTTNLNSFKVDSSGNVLLDGWGDLTVWDDKNWDSLDGNGDSANGTDSGSPEAPYCGIGSQVIRNYCCGAQNRNTDTSSCTGIVRWVFDNAARDCAYRCDAVEKGGDENGDETQPVVTDCGVGVQPARNNCCAVRYAGQYQGCIGYWHYDNSLRDCDFVCTDSLPQDEGDNGGGGAPQPFSYGDPVSNYCATVTKVSDKDTCCNDALKNGLSSGPHPGYPDCIGTWTFDVDKGCKFGCAEYTEMMKILDEIKLKAQSQQ